MPLKGCLIDEMKRLFNSFRRKSTPKRDSADYMTKLLTMLAMTDARELGCDQVLQALAEFAEMNQRGEDITQLMPMVRQHLNLCPDCMEEYQALIEALAFENRNAN